MLIHQDRARSVRVGMMLAALVALAPACRGMTSSKPPVHLNPNMDNVTYVGPQEPASFFADGRGMRPPVDGTVARGDLRDDTHRYTGVDPRSLRGDACQADADCGGFHACVEGTCRDYATALPAGLALDGTLLERGQERFGIYCTPCHGDAGLENGGVVPVRAANRGNAWLVPSLHGERPRSYALGQLFAVISNGFNTMPGYAAQIPVEDRWAIATYVRALQVGYEMPLAELPREIAAEQGWR